MKKDWKRILIFAFTGALLISSSAFAFQDVEQSPYQSQILQLKQAGVVRGVQDDYFQPQTEMNYAQAVTMIVAALDLNIDHLKFVKQPKASDSFDNVPEDAWYTDAFIIGYFNGLHIDKSVQPEDHITREQFADLLMSAIAATGDYAFTKMNVVLQDEDEVDPEYMSSLQNLLNAKIVTTDAVQKFDPKRVITREEAANMVYHAIEFVETVGTSVTESETNTDQPSAPSNENEDHPISFDDELKMTVTPVTDEIQKVTITWGAKPNSGYGVSIDRIEFEDEGKAHIYVHRNVPQKDMFYLQIITYPVVTTYLSSEWTPVLKLADEQAIEIPFDESIDASAPKSNELE